MGNCCSTEVGAVVAQRSSDKDEVGAVPYAALPSSPRKYAVTEDTEPHGHLDDEPVALSPASLSSFPSSSLSPEVAEPPAAADAFVPPPSAGSKKLHRENTHHVTIGDYNLRYSYYSKRGYYPDGTWSIQRSTCSRLRSTARFLFSFFAPHLTSRRLSSFVLC